MENRKHGELLPDNIRCIVSGPSNCVETNMMFNLLFERSGSENIYVFSKSVYQLKYIFREKLLSKIPMTGYYAFP